MPRAIIGFLASIACLVSVSFSAQADERKLPSRTVVVDPLAYATNGAGQSFGTCFPMTVTVGGYAPGTVRIGFFESEVGGSGPQWRAAGWAAALTAAQLTDFDAMTTQVSFDVQGRIDGPSAGALMTIAVLAAARGDTIRPDATMTGTINPDGIIGPVGGIAHKIDGAARKGKKLVLIPAGIAFDYDANEKKDVHLVGVGNKLGVEVRPVLDIYTAYKYMTGADLPHAAAEVPGKLALQVHSLVASRAQAWGDRHESALNAMKQLPDFARNSQFVKNFTTKAENQLYQVKSLLEEGEMSAAFHDQVRAAALSYLGLEVGRNLQTAQSNGIEGAINRIKDNNWLKQSVEQTAQQLNAFTPKTFDQLSMYLEAVDVFLMGASYRYAALETLENLPDEGKARVENALVAAGFQIVGWLNLQLAVDYLELSKKYGGRPIPEGAPIAALAQFYTRAGEANERVFDSLEIDAQAKEAGVSSERVKAILAVRDESYGTLQAAIAYVLPQIPTYFPDKPHRDIAQLAGGMFVYCRAAMLITKYYSLGAKLDDSLNVTGLRRERTFIDWLARSEEEAARSIYRLSQGGADTTTCRQMYEIAHVMRSRELADRLEALQLLFRASVSSRVLWEIRQTNPWAEE
jgi:hypothetical protein